MKKILLAALMTAAMFSPARADDEALTRAVGMFTTGLVYTIQCKPADEVVKQLARVSKVYTDAAGIDATNNRQFIAMVQIKSIEYLQYAKQHPDFCKQMNAAYEEGLKE